MTLGSTKFGLALFAGILLVTVAGADDRSKTLDELDQKSTQPVIKKDVSSVDIDQASPVTASTAVPDLQPAPALDETGDRAGEQVKWQVLSGGGGMTTIGTMKLGSTIGQAVAGPSAVGDYTLNAGFWQNFESDSPFCCVRRGDINHDGSPTLDISDLMWMIDFMFTSGPPPVCMGEADVNGDNSDTIDISDLIWLIDFMFTEGPEPIPCP